MITASHRRRTLSKPVRRNTLIGVIAAAVLAMIAASAPVSASPGYASFWGGQPNLVKRSIDMTVPVNVGTRFRTNTSGKILGVRVYLMGSRVRTNYTQLYDSRGRLLASATVQGSRTTGWRNVTFKKPVSVRAGTTVTAAAFLPFGHWAYSPRGLTKSVRRGPLTAVGGVYTFAKSVAYPTRVTKDALLVDLMFQSGTVSSVPVPKPTTTPVAKPTTTSTPTTKPTSSSPTPSTTTTTSKPTTSTTASSTTTSGSSAPVGNCAVKPSASNTGASGSLASSRTTTIDKDGTVLQNVSLGDDLRITADNVTVRNVKVNGTILVRQASGVKVDHVTAEGVAVSGSRNVVVQYANLSGGNDASGVTSDTGRASNVTLQYNYIHSPNPSPSAHYDGTQVRGVDGLKILCSTYSLGQWESTYNAAIYMENANGGTNDVTVANNWLDGGGITLYVTATNLTVTGNKFGRSYHWAPCRNLGQKFSSSGNSWADSGAGLTPCG